MAKKLLQRFAEIGPQLSSRDHTLRSRVDVSATIADSLPRDESGRFDCAVHSRQNLAALAALHANARQLEFGKIRHARSPEV